LRYIKFPRGLRRRITVGPDGQSFGITSLNWCSSNCLSFYDKINTVVVTVE